MRRRDSLKDLPGVEVVVEHFSDAAGQAGFDRQAFQTDVELKLRMVGIRVFETDDQADRIVRTGHGVPQLYVNVNAFHRKRGQSEPYSISLELIQDVLLRHQSPSSSEGSPEASTFATTWSSRVLGLGTVARVRDVCKDLVDQFANDWLAVNPLNGTA